MSILYLKEQGSSLHICGERLVVHKEDETILDIPYFHIEKIFLFGNVQLTTQATNFILDHSIPCSFFTTHGRYHGMLHPIESGNVFLRVCQYERYLDYSFRLAVAKRIVEGKIKNQIDYLVFFNKNHPSIKIQDVIKKMNEMKASIFQLTQIDSTMGIEGKSSTYYFSCFKELIRKNFNFNGRNRQPPKDPINALLSLSYSMLTHEVFSLLCGSGFDPYIGFLHELSYNRPSLALDIVEEFRPVMDRFVFKLVNLEILNTDDFINENEGVFLSDDARSEYFKQYECWMENSNLRKIIKSQVMAMMRTIQVMDEYAPYQWGNECIM